MFERLEMHDVHLRVAKRLLLRTGDLTLRAGERWAVLGPNGVGKSRFLATLAGLLPVAQGIVALDGRPLAAYAPRALARLRTYLPQRVDDAFSASVLDTVLLARHPYGQAWSLPDPADVAQALAALALFDAQALAERDVCHLSGGERQRVALAMAWAQDTPVVLLDEPLTHLDVRHQVQALEVWASRPDKLIVAVLHDLQGAARFASHVLLLDGAGGVMAGSADSILREEVLSPVFGMRLRRMVWEGETFFLPEVGKGVPDFSATQFSGETGPS